MSTHYLALDIGSTTVVAIVIDLDTNAVVGAASAANSSEVTSAANKRLSRSEWDLDAMTELAIENAAALLARTNARPAAIGVTGQQQGLQTPRRRAQCRRALFLLAGPARSRTPTGPAAHLLRRHGPARRFHRHRGRDARLCQYRLSPRGWPRCATPVLAASQQSASQRRQRHSGP